jgi:dTDP-glucose 4,6-dehydratase
VARVFKDHSPDAIFHLAAESHVDRSIHGPAPFIQTNILGTYVLLEAATGHWEALPAERQARFRFIHVSTDEVYGSLGDTGQFTEETAYDPRSPYSASKASGDHLTRAWHHTYGLPAIVTNACNNYGPFQYPEKLIPLAIQRALDGEPIPLYGTGKNVRDWIYVEDHVLGLLAALERGEPGESYNFGARSEITNLELIRQVCRVLDQMEPFPSAGGYRSLISFVEDRPGHDWRYAIDPSKAEEALGWSPEESLSGGLVKTVVWYLENREWCRLTSKRARAGPGRSP